MIKIAYSPAFVRAYKKQIKNQISTQLLFNEKVTLFLQDPYHPQLRTHKLSGKLKDFYSFTIGYDLRVIFYFASENEVIFENIGSHDEVY
ncbi:MAG: type II toxin-antitoxin system mRNA interferase toxin, RelE/StbE family [Ferruginibacter sp.]